MVDFEKLNRERKRKRSELDDDPKPEIKEPRKRVIEHETDAPMERDFQERLKDSRSVIEALEEEFAPFRKRLKIDLLNIDHALAEQGDIEQQIGKEYALAISQRDGQKEYLKEIEYRIRQRVASQLERDGRKMLAKDLDAAVDADSEQVRERRRLNDLNTRLNYIEDSIKGPWRSRGVALHNIAQGQIGEGKGYRGSSEYERDDGQRRNRREELTDRTR